MQSSWELVRERMADAERRAQQERLTAALRASRTRPGTWWQRAGVELRTGGGRRGGPRAEL